jgi:cytochrome c5
VSRPCFVRLAATVAIVAAVGGSIVKSQEPSLPEGEGKDVVERMCADQCHGLTTVVSARLAKEQWDATVKAMVARGAEGTDEDVQKAVDYLAKYFGKANPKDGTPVLSRNASRAAMSAVECRLCRHLVD